MAPSLSEAPRADGKFDYSEVAFDSIDSEDHNHLHYFWSIRRSQEPSGSRVPRLRGSELTDRGIHRERKRCPPAIFTITAAEVSPCNRQMSKSLPVHGHVSPQELPSSRKKWMSDLASPRRRVPGEQVLEALRRGFEQQKRFPIAGS